MKDIPVHKLDTFKRGERTLGCTACGGTVDFNTKGGDVTVAYGPGALVLFDAGGFIAGPLTVEGARDLADRVLDGDARVITDPKTQILLAMAIAGHLFTPEFDEPASAPLKAEAPHV